MKTELRRVPHSIVPDEFVVEVWHDGAFLAIIAGHDGPGVRIVTKHRIVVDHPVETWPAAPIVVEVQFPKEGRR